MEEKLKLALSEPSDLLAASLHATPIILRKHGWQNAIQKLRLVADEVGDRSHAAKVIIALLLKIESEVSEYAKVGSLLFNSLVDKKLMSYCFNRNTEKIETVYS